MNADAIRSRLAAFLDAEGWPRYRTVRDYPDHALRAGDELLFDDDLNLVGILRLSPAATDAARIAADFAPGIAEAYRTHSRGERA